MVAYVGCALFGAADEPDALGPSDIFTDFCKPITKLLAYSVLRDLQNEQLGLFLCISNQR